MSEKIFDKDVTYRAKVRVKAGTDEIIIRPEAQGKPAKKDVVERGDSQMYTTTGKRNPKRVIQLQVPEKSSSLTSLSWRWAARQALTRWSVR